jgi:hypothetical protein
MTDPTWTIDEDGDPVWPPHIPSEEFELTGFYLTADPCCEEASAQIPEGAHADLVRCVRDAGLLPAALDVIEAVRQWGPYTPRRVTRALQAFDAVAKDRQP